MEKKKKQTNKKQKGIELNKFCFKEKLTEKVFLETLLNQLSKEIVLEQQCRHLLK